jgi:hypothetical protein
MKLSRELTPMRLHGQLQQGAQGCFSMPRSILTRLQIGRRKRESGGTPTETEAVRPLKTAETPTDFCHIQPKGNFKGVWLISGQRFMGISIIPGALKTSSGGLSEDSTAATGSLGSEPSLYEKLLLSFSPLESRPLALLFPKHDIAHR